MRKATVKTSGKVALKTKGAPAARTTVKLVPGKASAAKANGHMRANPAPRSVTAAPKLVATAAAPSPRIPIDSRYVPYERALLARRAELAGAIGESKFDTLARLGRVAEEDQAQISHEEFISLQRNSMDYQALRLVDGALDRLRTGEYGVCDECDEPISEKRLAAIPWARYCVRCQERMQSLDQDPSYAQAESW